MEAVGRGDQGQHGSGQGAVVSRVAPGVVLQDSIAEVTAGEGEAAAHGAAAAPWQIRRGAGAGVDCARRRVPAVVAGMHPEATLVEAQDPPLAGDQGLGRIRLEQRCTAPVQKVVAQQLPVRAVQNGAVATAHQAVAQGDAAPGAGSSGIHEIQVMGMLEHQQDPVPGTEQMDGSGGIALGQQQVGGQTRSDRRGEGAQTRVRGRGPGQIRCQALQQMPGPGAVGGPVPGVRFHQGRDECAQR
jgi:hypothetical protein